MTTTELFLRDHILLAVMPVYFLSTGLRTNREMGGVAVIGAALLLMAVMSTMVTTPIVAPRLKRMAGLIWQSH